MISPRRSSVSRPLAAAAASAAISADDLPAPPGCVGERGRGARQGRERRLVNRAWTNFPFRSGLDPRSGGVGRRPGVSRSGRSRVSPFTLKLSIARRSSQSLMSASICFGWEERAGREERQRVVIFQSIVHSEGGANLFQNVERGRGTGRRGRTCSRLRSPRSVMMRECLPRRGRPGAARVLAMAGRLKPNRDKTAFNPPTRRRDILPPRTVPRTVVYSRVLL